MKRFVGWFLLATAWACLAGAAWAADVRVVLPGQKVKKHVSLDGYSPFAAKFTEGAALLFIENSGSRRIEFGVVDSEDNYSVYRLQPKAARRFKKPGSYVIRCYSKEGCQFLLRVEPVGGARPQEPAAGALEELKP